MLIEFNGFETTSVPDTDDSKVVRSKQHPSFIYCPVMIFIELLSSVQPGPKERAGTDTLLLCDTMLIISFP